MSFLFYSSSNLLPSKAGVFPESTRGLLIVDAEKDEKEGVTGVWGRGGGRVGDNG